MNKLLPGATDRSTQEHRAVWLGQGLLRQISQNFERTQRRAATVYGLGTHHGFGEEGAENDNAATARSAGFQASMFVFLACPLPV
ncbi:MAG TPA: hypothetical protein VNY05_16975, partial [Candidatus Acidoferrales bacterium]|nr:hypothetical protein [Candidatus Acidoferrales bacterium]